jgi:hypothetical protein
MDLSYTKIIHFENICFYVKCKQKFEIYLYFHISKWLQKVSFLPDFEVCLNVINTALQDLMYLVSVFHAPIFHILQQICIGENHVEIIHFAHCTSHT